MNGHTQGKTGEAVVQRAGDYLMKTWGEVLMHVATKLLDSAGVDRLFILKSGLAFPLQVKTSDIGVRDHLREDGRRRWYRSVAVIKVTREELGAPHAPETIHAVAERIKELILESYQKVKDQPLAK
jgi:hypothetical protein